MATHGDSPSKNGTRSRIPEDAGEVQQPATLNVARSLTPAEIRVLTQQRARLLAAQQAFQLHAQVYAESQTMLTHGVEGFRVDLDRQAIVPADG